MRAFRVWLFMLVILAGVLVSVVPARALDACTGPGTKLRDGSACLTDLNGKWNELITRLDNLDFSLNKAANSIENACSDLGSDDTCSPPESTIEPDPARAKAEADDALADLDTAVSVVEEIAGSMMGEGIIQDFLDELSVQTPSNFLTKVNHGYPFRTRNRTSLARTVQLIQSLMNKALGVMNGGSTGGVEGNISNATSDLEAVSANLDADQPDVDAVISQLKLALTAVNQAINAKDRVLRKYLSTVHSSLGKMITIFKIAMNNPRRASAGVAVQAIDPRARVYALNGKGIPIDSSQALSRNGLANGVFVVIYTEDGRIYVQKLVVLH